MFIDYWKGPAAVVFCLEDGGNLFIRNVGTNMLHCEVSRSGRLYWWYSLCSTNRIMMLLCVSV
jgi:hypothetical protein